MQHLTSKQDIHVDSESEEDEQHHQPTAQILTWRDFLLSLLLIVKGWGLTGTRNYRPRMPQWQH